MPEYEERLSKFERMCVVRVRFLAHSLLACYILIVWLLQKPLQISSATRLVDDNGRVSPGVVVAQAWREDRTLIAAADVIADALGQRFVESAPLNMERAWAESSPRVPLICLLSAGQNDCPSTLQMMQMCFLAVCIRLAIPPKLSRTKIDE